MAGVVMAFSSEANTGLDWRQRPFSDACAYNISIHEWSRLSWSASGDAAFGHVLQVWVESLADQT